MRRWLSAAALALSPFSPADSVRAQAPLPPVSVFEAYFAAAERRDLDALAGLFAPGAVYQDIPFEFRIQGRERIRAMLADALAGLDPVERRVLRMVADSTTVMVEWEARGVHSGPMLGVPPSGRVLRLRAVSILEIRNGLIARVTDYTDRAGLEKQLRGGGS